MELYEIREEIGLHHLNVCIRNNYPIWQSSLANVFAQTPRRASHVPQISIRIQNEDPPVRLEHTMQRTIGLWWHRVVNDDHPLMKIALLTEYVPHEGACLILVPVVYANCQN